jgi:hypothetical protein
VAPATILSETSSRPGAAIAAPAAAAREVSRKRIRPGVIARAKIATSGSE